MNRILLRGGFAVMAALVLAVSPGIALAEPTPGSLDQKVDANEQNADGQVVIDAGHVDLGPRFIDGKWRLQLRDDTKAPPVWRYLDDVVIHLPDTSILPAPSDEQFSFLDAKPGADVYVIPQTQNTDVVWVGWNSQDPQVVGRLNGGMTLRLHGVQGPGQFVLFLQNGNFDPAQLLWTSAKSEPQDLWAESNSHVHGNWVFTTPGIYVLDVEVRGELTDGTTASDRTLLRIAVGDRTNPQQAFTTTATPEPVSDTSTRPAGTAREQQDGSRVSGAVLIGGAVVLVVAILIAVGALRTRNARRLADQQNGE